MRLEVEARSLELLRGRELTHGHGCSLSHVHARGKWSFVSLGFPGSPSH